MVWRTFSLRFGDRTSDLKHDPANWERLRRASLPRTWSDRAAKGSLERDKCALKAGLGHDVMFSRTRGRPRRVPGGTWNPLKRHSFKEGRGARDGGAGLFP